jgi:hypothetical protein
LLYAVPCQAKIIHVDADANGMGDGTSWADAYNYLQNALITVWPGDEIHVAEGIYTPDLLSPPPPLLPMTWINSQSAEVALIDRTATFQLKNGVVIKGGYAGYGEADSNARDIDLYETILSGDIGIPDDNSDNSYHVVTGSGTDETAVLDGFTITGGNANSLNPHDQGGGMFSQRGHPTLANCTFIGNSAKRAAGMYNERSRPILTNCTFSSNSAGHTGGGMVNLEGSNAELLNCKFIDNQAGSRGAQYTIIIAAQQ